MTRPSPRRPFALVLVLPLVAALAACGPAAPSSAPVADEAAADAGAPVDAPAEAPTAAPAAADASAGEPAAEGVANILKLNLNTATEDELRTIPGIGDRMVVEFMAHRPYDSIVQFRTEIGKSVDADQVAEFERYVYVPIDPDTADLPTLMQFPGISEPLAKKLMAARPFESTDMFLSLVAQTVRPENLAVGAAYVATK